MLKRYLRSFTAFLLGFALLTAMPAHAAKFYVESRLGDLTAEQRVTVEWPRPVQLVFNFTTNQQHNSAATKYLREDVLKHVRESGLFSEVQDTPVEGGAKLVITIDNIPDAQPASKGAASGLTFGLVKAVVYDLYVVEAEYKASPDAPAITSQVTHAMWMSRGSKEVPIPGAVLVKNLTAAVEIIARQSVTHAVNELARNPDFPNKPDEDTRILPDLKV